MTVSRPISRIGSFAITASSPVAYVNLRWVFLLYLWGGSADASWVLKPADVSPLVPMFFSRPSSKSSSPFFPGWQGLYRGFEAVHGPSLRQMAFYIHGNVRSDLSVLLSILLLLVVSFFPRFTHCANPRHSKKACTTPGTCGRGNVCVDGNCFINRDSVCSARATLKCVTGTRCVNQRCRKISSAGQTCRRAGKDFRECDKGLVCQSHICRIIENGSCLGNTNRCRTGTVCVGRPDKMQCRKPMGAGQRCGTDPFWVCQSSLTCQGDVCRVRVGGVCLISGRQVPCLNGLSCVRNGRTRRCRAVKGPGERCANTAVCDTGLVCQGRICKVSIGQSCVRDGETVPCVSGALCVGSGNKCVCQRAAAAGQQCNGETQICQTGLTCQSGRCKIPVGKSCKQSRGSCVSGAICSRNGSNWTCRNVADAGENCGRGTTCAAGLVCQGQKCRVGKGGLCGKDNRKCANGLKCNHHHKCA